MIKLTSNVAAIKKTRYNNSKISMTFILFLDMENSIKEQEGANRGNYADIRIKKCQVCRQKS